MSRLQEMLSANREFCHHLPQEFRDEPSPQAKLPSKQVAIVACMDTRLVNFLEPALGIDRCEAKVIKTAGNGVTGPFDGTVRSLLVCVYELGVEEIFIIGHHECGMAKTTSEGLTKKMLARGVRPEAIHMVQHELEVWADEFHHPRENVVHTVEALRMNPLIPADVKIHGLIFDPHTGEVEVVVDGDI